MFSFYTLTADLSVLLCLWTTDESVLLSIFINWWRECNIVFINGWRKYNYVRTAHVCNFLCMNRSSKCIFLLYEWTTDVCLNLCLVWTADVRVMLEKSGIFKHVHRRHLCATIHNAVTCAQRSKSISLDVSIPSNQLISSRFEWKSCTRHWYPQGTSCDTNSSKQFGLFSFFF